MTDDALQYYKGLQSDIEAVKKRIEFIKNCLEKMNSIRWSFQIQDPCSQFRFVGYDLNVGTVRGILLNDLMVYRNHLKDLERRYADNSILEVTENG